MQFFCFFVLVSIVHGRFRLGNRRYDVNKKSLYCHSNRYNGIEGVILRAYRIICAILLSKSSDLMPEDRKQMKK